MKIYWVGFKSHSSGVHDLLSTKYNNKISNKEIYEWYEIILLSIAVLHIRRFTCLLHFNNIIQITDRLLLIITISEIRETNQFRI